MIPTVKLGSLNGYRSDAPRDCDDRLTWYVGNVVSGRATEECSRIHDGDDLCRFDCISLNAQPSAANRIRST